MITKKHFKAIADIIRVNTHTAQKQGMQTYISTWAVEELINYFSQINPSFDKDSLDRYMQLFQVFKLKVAEAEALGYDTLPRLQKELEGYKKQLALPYLIDSVQNQAMVQDH